jgi:hypothetical protein
MIFFKVRVLYLFFEEVDVLSSGTNEVDSFEVHEFLLYVLYLLDEVDIVFVELWLGVNDRDYTWSLRVEHERLHLCNLGEESVEVVLSDWEEVYFVLLFYHQLNHFELSDYSQYKISIILSLYF